MQAYASAQLTPLESESHQAQLPSIKPASGAVVNGAAVTQLDSASPIAALMSAIVDGLSDSDLGVLARRLLPHLRQPTEPNDGRSAYTWLRLPLSSGYRRRRFAALSPAGSSRRSSGERDGSSLPSPFASGRHRLRRDRGPDAHAARPFRRPLDRRSVPFSAHQPALKAGDERREDPAGRWRGRVAGAVAPAWT